MSSPNFLNENDMTLEEVNRKKFKVVLIPVSEEEFSSYLKVQFSAKYNMMSRGAIMATGLSDDKYEYILEHYGELKDIYYEAYEEIITKK